MIRNETIIAVDDVSESAKWYQELFECKINLNNPYFEILSDQDGTVILCLHKWGEPERPTMISPDIPIGNGLILYFRVSDINKIMRNAVRLKLKIERGLHYNENAKAMQFALRDLDGYYILVSE